MGYLVFILEVADAEGVVEDYLVFGDGGAHLLLHDQRGSLERVEGEMELRGFPRVLPVEDLEDG
jgi:hypothetical protein